MTGIVFLVVTSVFFAVGIGMVWMIIFASMFAYRGEWHDFSVIQRIFFAIVLWAVVTALSGVANDMSDLILLNLFDITGWSIFQDMSEPYIPSD
jgi:hypothetical protein